MATWNAGLDTDDIRLSQLCHKHSLNIHRVRPLCHNIYNYFANYHSILITDYPLSFRACLLEYFIYKQILSTSGKTVFLHISKFVLEQIPTLDVRKTKLFGGNVTYTELDNTKKIFTITIDDYFYLANTIIPTPPRGGVLYIYFGNDVFNSSQLPGFQDIQNLIMADELLPSYSHKVLYPFIHLYDKRRNSKTKFSIHNDSRSIPVHDYLPIPRSDTTLLDMLVKKYSIQKQTRIIEYLASLVMDFIESGESMVVDGFNNMLLLCLIDYIIEKRLDRAACLYTLVDFTKKTRGDLQKLEVAKTQNYEHVKKRKNTPKFSNEVIFSKFTQRMVNQPVPHNCILVSYTFNGCRFTDITLFQGSFFSFSTDTLEGTLLSSTSRPYTRISYLLNDVKSTYWDGFKFLTTKPVNTNSPPKFGISENVSIPPTPEELTSITDPITDPIINPKTDAIMDQTTYPIKHPTPDAIMDPITGPIMDQTTDPIKHPITGPIIDQTSDPIKHPTPDAIMDPITRPIIDQTSDPMKHPITDPIMDPITGPIIDQTSDPIKQPTPDAIMDPITGPIMDQTTDPIKQPTTDPITISALSPTRNAQRVDGLIYKHDIQQHFHIFHKLSSSVMDYTERGDSVVVEGFDTPTLICLMDHVIMEKVRGNSGLPIVVDYNKNCRKSFSNLDIMETKDFEILKSSVEISNKVVFALLNEEMIDSLNTHSQDSTLICFTTSGHNFKLLNLLNCPFISLACSNLSERVLSKISRPFTLITYKDLDKLRYISRNEPKEVQTPVNDTLPYPRNDHASMESVSNEPYSPFYTKYLLERLTMKYNCNLDVKICYTLYELLENGESVIVDYFSRPQLLYIIDFTFAMKTYQKVSFLETKTLIFCQLKWLDSVFKDLDMVRSNQHTILMPDGYFDRNKKVLVLKKLENTFLERLNQNLMIDNSYLLVRLAKKRNAKFVHLTNELNCSFLGLSEGIVASPPKKPFVHLRGNGLGGFRVMIPAEGTSNNDERVQDRDYDEPLDSPSIPDTPDIPLDIYPLFLEKHNPITTHIYELLNKFVIELLYTDLPTDLYVTTFTYLIEYRNVCLDGFPFEQLAPLLTVYALECQELGFPVSIHYGDSITELSTDKLENIPIILNKDLIQTLTENIDVRHIWIFIGADNTLLTQVIPLLSQTHQVIFLLSNTVSAVFERSCLAFTRIYKFLNCVFVRSFNQHLLQEYTNDLTLGMFVTETSLQTDSNRFVEIEPNQGTATLQLNDNSQEMMQDTSVNQEFTQIVEEYPSLNSDTNDLDMTNIPLAEFKIAELSGNKLQSDLIETKSESTEEFINFSHNHSPNIPDTDNVLEYNTTADLHSQRIEADSGETDNLLSNDIKESLGITETKFKSILPEDTQNSNDANTTDIFHHLMDNESPKMETFDINSTEHTVEHMSDSQQQQQQQQEVILPENTMLESNSCHPSEIGTQFATSPLQHGMNTILYSSDSTFYNQLILRLTEVLDYLHPTLQVVITSANPSICSKLLKLVSSHINSSTRGFLYKFGPINSLREYIIKHEVQILSLPFMPLLDLIQSDTCLFIDNKIIVYVDDSTTSCLDNHNLRILTDETADQFIFILPDKTTLFSLPSPYCEIELSSSAKNESYSVEFNFED